MAKCGDCIHADICKQVNGGWFSPENIAYCKGFKDRTKYVEVVRCKDCENCYPVRLRNGEVYFYECDFHDIEVEPDDFCSYGERRTNASKA